MLLHRLVRTSAAVAGSAGKLAKVAAIAELLREVPPAEIPIAVAFLSGELTQRQIGAGYAAIVDLLGTGGASAVEAGAGGAAAPDGLADPPTEPALTLAAADA